MSMHTPDLLTSLSSLSIREESHSEAKLDVTDEFFATTNKIEFSTIVKSNNFSLLQGTHALELLNPRLDSYSLKLVDYDIFSELDINAATAIISNQLKSVVSWLGENNSLSTSILSSDYINKILIHYTKFGELHSFLQKCHGWTLIVFKFSILLIANVKFIIELSMKSQIYPDEDLNTSTMNLNWLMDMSNNEIFRLTLVSNTLWSQLNDDAKPEYFSFIKNSFHLLQSILSLDSVLKWKSPLFNSNSKDFEIKLNNKIKQFEQILEKLSSFELLDLNLDPPKNSFNINSQYCLDNQLPPKHLTIHKLEWEFCILNFNQLFNDLMDVLTLFKCSNLIQLFEWLNYLEHKRNNVNNEVVGLHIIPMILLFVVTYNMDSEPQNSTEINYLFNNPQLTFKVLFYQYFKEFSLSNSIIDLEISKNKPSSQFLQQIDYYFETISVFWKELLFLPTLNPSRQRQFKCKESKYWNMRQYESGSLEDFFIENRFYKCNTKFYPLTFNIIYLKLKSMIENILKMVELHLFKDVREYLPVYYQLTLFTFQMDQQLDLIISSVEKNKMSSTYLKFLKYEYQLINRLSIIKSKQYEILTYLGFNTLPNKLIKNDRIQNFEELLYNIQWKQFHSIKDPEVLDYKEFKKMINKSIKEIENEGVDIFTKKVEMEVSHLSSSFNKDMAAYKKLLDQLDWFKELKNVTITKIDQLQDEFNKSNEDFKIILKLFNTKKIDTNNNKVDIKYLGRHRFFPGIKISQ